MTNEFPNDPNVEWRDLDFEIFVMPSSFGFRHFPSYLLHVRYLVKAKLKSRQETSANRRDQQRCARARLHRRRRISTQHARGARGQIRNCDLGENLLLRSAARGRAPVLGRVFRTAQRKGCALATQLPARERNRAVGLLRLRLHETAGGKTPNSKRVISQHVALAEKQFLHRLPSFVLVTLSDPIRHSGFVISLVLFHWEHE